MPVHSYWAYTLYNLQMHIHELLINFINNAIAFSASPPIAACTRSYFTIIKCDRMQAWLLPIVCISIKVTQEWRYCRPLIGLYAYSQCELCWVHPAAWRSVACPSRGPSPNSRLVDATSWVQPRSRTSVGSVCQSCHARRPMPCSRRPIYKERYLVINATQLQYADNVSTLLNTVMKTFDYTYQMFIRYYYRTNKLAIEQHVT